MGISLTLPENKITVITGKNGSGKTRLLEQIKSGITNWLDDMNCTVLDYDSHCNLSESDLEKFISTVKEKSKHSQFIIASLNPKVIEIADMVITLRG